MGQDFHQSMHHQRVLKVVKWTIKPVFETRYSPTRTKVSDMVECYQHHFQQALSSLLLQSRGLYRASEKFGRPVLCNPLERNCRLLAGLTMHL